MRSMCRHSMLKFFLLAICFISGCSSKPYVVDRPKEGFVGGLNQVYVVRHGWHTGFVIPAVDIHKSVPELKKRFPHARNIEFGWGDKGFYQAEEITTGITLQAMFWPTESVVHAVAVPNDVERYFFGSNIEILCLSVSEYLSLINFISNSFARNEAGDVVPQKSGIYGNSQFYQGVGSFYFMNTCNKWTAKGLRSAGLSIAPMFKLTAGSIINYLGSQGQALTKNCSGF